jgi:uncharacterized protein
MKSIYLISVERYSGKTATCLALGSHMKEDGFQVGYLKPLSLQPWRIGNHISDEDAVFVKEVLELTAEAWELSPVVITPELLHTRLADPKADDLMQKVKDAFLATQSSHDILLLEGGGSLREGYVVGLPSVGVAQALGSQVLVIAKYRDDIRLMDDILAAQARLGQMICGIIINRVPPEAEAFVVDTAVPFLERNGLPVFGVLPEKHGLSALTVGELIPLLEAETLTKHLRPTAMIENLTVGAMTAEAALSRFRKTLNKAVITGGDRTDIQLAALETSTTCLILTGNLHPSPLIVRQAEEFGVAVLLVRTNTMETIEKIERVFGKTRLGQTAKLKQFRTLLDQHCDYQRLYQAIGIK